MKISQTELEGLKVIHLDVWRDTRGFFMERFHLEKFKQNGLPSQFLQDNHSRSLSNVVRGLHFQKAPEQGKLIGVIQGKIWDVAVDIRKGSPTYGRHFSIELSGENGTLLWIPGGFAHGFCVISEEPADVFYKVDAMYNPQSESGICWSDPDLNISWPVKNPIISERDQNLPLFRDLKV